jgi:hypothetical protein
MTCDAEILAQERRQALTVPLQAVVLRVQSPGQAETTGVFGIRDGLAAFIPVTPGIIGGLEMEVEGVDEGTPLIIGPFQILRTLQDGNRIRRNQTAP